MGKKSGYGILIIDGQLKYKGMWENDYPHGKGENYLEDGEKYVGEFAEGKMQG